MMLGELSERVREAVADQIEVEEWQSDWAYSKLIVLLDVLWNLAFLVVIVTLLGLSVHESPQVPLRIWVIGYGLQCVFHIICALSEYKRRNRRRWSSTTSTDFEQVSTGNEDETRATKHLESANLMLSFIWWVIGFYWITYADQDLTNESPQLYWIVLTFLAFDVVFVIGCLVVPCLVRIGVCCCLPCIIGILCLMTDQFMSKFPIFFHIWKHKGATEEEIKQLPVYKFYQKPTSGVMVKPESGMPIKHSLSRDDAECCICLCGYENGTDVRELPCRHHFHCNCIDKWLFIDPTCPLCKFNILNNQRGCEVV